MEAWSGRCRHEQPKDSHILQRYGALRVGSESGKMTIRVVPRGQSVPDGGSRSGEKKFFGEKEEGGAEIGGRRWSATVLVRCSASAIEAGPVLCIGVSDGRASLGRKGPWAPAISVLWRWNMGAVKEAGREAAWGAVERRREKEERSAAEWFERPLKPKWRPSVSKLRSFENSYILENSQTVNGLKIRAVHMRISEIRISETFGNCILLSEYESEILDSYSDSNIHYPKFTKSSK
ncbi:hypothetical protein LXL04_018190 [Taraxacum kok-saghyz]